MPEVITHKLTLNDLIIVIGSDGLFEHLTNEEIIDTVSKYYESNEIEAACDDLLRRALKSW